MGGLDRGPKALALAFLASMARAAGGSPPSSPENHLAGEKSPYLLQHVHNPVDWHPWGEAAFAQARKEDKPIFLSIGYATCHWCHVMERESFSDPKIAELLNRHFVAIKVDREERPDVDRLYMTAVQALTGSGGWPLNVWLTPELQPFFGGTYFPPEPRWGQPGFPQVLERLAELWRDQRPKLLQSGARLAEFLKQSSAVKPDGGPAGASALDKAASAFEQAYDGKDGGFGPAPKFPMPVNQNFLLRAYARTKDKRALEPALGTLKAMARGGIHDQLGGGFHRYSTDDRWHVPHFEKMLYDNAQLAVNYLEAYQVAGGQELARAAADTLGYIVRDLGTEGGGFASAEDADSLPPELAGKVDDRGHENRREGAFYLWSKDEIMKLLGPDLGELFSFRFGVEPGGNAESDPHGDFAGRNILYEARTVEEAAKRFKKTPGEARELLEGARKRLLEARSRRPRPQRDDKVIAAWNGLAISALAKGAQVLEDPDDLAAAVKAASFIKDRMTDPATGRLYRRWRDGERKVPGTADDYAFLAQGLIDLYEASFDPRWLDWALQLTERELKDFYDPQDGGFYMTSADADPRLLARTKEDADNVEPSASSISAMNLLRLAQFAERRDFQQAAEKTLALFGGRLEAAPRSLPQMLCALDFALSKPQQIVIAGAPGAPDTEEMLRQVNRRYLPSKILLLAGGGRSQEDLARSAPFARNLKPIKGKATAYVCINYACELPTTDLAELGRILDGDSLKPPVP